MRTCQVACAAAKRLRYHHPIQRRADMHRIETDPTKTPEADGKDPIQAAELAINLTEGIARDLSALNGRLEKELEQIQAAHDGLIRKDPQWDQPGSVTTRLKGGMDKIRDLLANIPRGF